MPEDPYDFVYLDRLCVTDRQGKPAPAMTIPPSAWEPVGAARQPDGRWGRIRALVSINGASVYLIAEAEAPGFSPWTTDDGVEGGRLVVRRRWYRLTGCEPL